MLKKGIALLIIIASVYVSFKALLPSKVSDLSTKEIKDIAKAMFINLWIFVFDWFKADKLLANVENFTVFSKQSILSVIFLRVDEILSASNCNS